MLPVNFRTIDLSLATRRQINQFRPTIRQALRDCVLGEERVFFGSLAFSSLLAGVFVLLLHIADHQEKVRFLPRPDNAYSTELLVDMPSIEKNPISGGDGDKAFFQKGLDNHLVAAADFVQQFKDSGASNIDWGTFFISSEYYAQHLQKETYLMPPLKLKELLDIFNRDNDFFDSISAEPSMSRLDKLKWLKQYVYSKSVSDPGAHVITSLLYENGGQNCQTRTKYLLSLASSYGDRLLAPGERFVAAIYKNHEDLGIYNETTGKLRLFNDLDNETTAWAADLYDPHILVQGFLDRFSWDKGKLTDYGPYLIAKANLDTGKTKSPDILGPISSLNFQPRAGSDNIYGNSDQPLTREMSKPPLPRLPINDQLVREVEDAFSSLLGLLMVFDAHPDLLAEETQQLFSQTATQLKKAVKLIEGAGVFPPGNAKVSFTAQDRDSLSHLLFGRGSNYLAHLPKREQIDILRNYQLLSVLSGHDYGFKLPISTIRLALTTDDNGFSLKVDNEPEPERTESVQYYDRDLFVLLFIDRSSGFIPNAEDYLWWLFRLDKASAQYIKQQMIQAFQAPTRAIALYGFTPLASLYSELNKLLKSGSLASLSVTPDARDCLLLLAYELYLGQLTDYKPDSRDRENKAWIESTPAFKNARETYIRLVGKDSLD